MWKALILDGQSIDDVSAWSSAIQNEGFIPEVATPKEVAEEGPLAWKVVVVPVTTEADFEAVNLFSGFPREWALVLVMRTQDNELWARASREGAEVVVDGRSGPAEIARAVRAGVLLRAEIDLRALPLEQSCLCPVELGAGESLRFVRTLGRIFGSKGCTTIEAEEGCGGESLARWLHLLREREGAFHSFDCGTVEAEKVQELLLGSASWGQGFLERARGGTLLLRNCHKLPSNTQAALGLCLRNREYTRPGTGDKVELDVDIIALGQVSLADQAAEGLFNRSLAVALGETFIQLPPLRERSDEIAAMASAWAAKSGNRCSLTPAVMKAMKDYLWPGNVWELRHVLEVCFDATGQGGTFQPFHLPPALRKSCVAAADEEDSLYLLPRLNQKSVMPKLRNFREQARVQAERVYLLRVLEQTEGKVTEARQMAGLSKSSFYALLGKHDLLPSRH